jgi:hypothetical protein
MNTLTKSLLLFGSEDFLPSVSFRDENSLTDNILQRTLEKEDEDLNCVNPARNRD